MRSNARFWGICISVLGLGILLASFLPEVARYVLLSILTVAAGILFLCA